MTGTRVGDTTAVIYLRVSTREQARRGGEKEGYSIPAQRGACTRQVTELGATLEAEFVDAGASAKSADRAGLQDLLSFIERQHPTYVVVHKLDRLARNRIDDLTITLALKRAGVTLVSVMERIDDTPQGKLMHGVHSALAEYYVENLAWEVKKGTKQKVMKGGTANRAALGYRNVGVIVNEFEERVVAIDEARAPHITWMFEQYATGEWSYHRLAEAVTARGLTTRPTKARAAGSISFKQVQQILTNKYYTGVVTHGGVEHPGKHQRLVSDELFAQVQEAIARHRKAGERSSRHHHYLSGSLRCGSCGHGLIYNVITGSKGDRYDYFTCIGRHTYKNGCQLPYLPVEDLEVIIEDIWRHEQLTTSQVKQLKDDLLSVIETEETKGKREAKLLDQRIAAVKAERIKWAEAAVNGTAPADIVRDKQTILGQQLLALTSRRELLLQVGGDHRHNLERVVNLFEDCGRGYSQASPAIRRAYNQAWFTRIDIDVDDDQDNHVPRVVQVEREQPFNSLRQAAELGDSKTDQTRPKKTPEAPTKPTHRLQPTSGRNNPNRTPSTPDQRKHKEPAQDSCPEQVHLSSTSRVDHLVGVAGFEPTASSSRFTDSVVFQGVPKYAFEQVRCRLARSSGCCQFLRFAAESGQ